MRSNHNAQDILRGKWKVMIIACLSAFGKKCYTELQHIIEGIGTKMLSKELQELEINGLITRTVMPTKAVTEEYEITDYGQTLRPIIDEMADLGKQHKAKIISGIKSIADQKE